MCLVGYNNLGAQGAHLNYLFIYLFLPEISMRYIVRRDIQREF